MSSRTGRVGPAASRVLNAKLLWRIDDRMAVRTTRRSSSPATRVFQLMHPSTGRIHQKGVTDLHMDAAAQALSRHSLRERGGGDEENAAYEGGSATQL